MQETFILVIEIFCLYLLGMGISYVVVAKIIGYDNMIGDEEFVANCIIAGSWIGIAIAIIGLVVYGLKRLIDFIFKIKQN